MDIFGVAINALKPALDDDFIDRANYYYTPSVLLLFALIISTRQWIGQPIECWVPAEFNRAWEEYTENYCYIQDTYWLPMDQPAFMNLYSNQKRISYYQWVPFILAAQAMLFTAPFALWRLFSFRSGFNVDTVVSAAKECALTRYKSEEASRMAILAAFISNVLSIRMAFNRRWAKASWFSRLTCTNYFLTIVYTVVKLLYVLNGSLQLIFLEKLLSTGGRLDMNVFPTLVSGVGWQQSGSFPRVTICSFEVRLLGNINRHTVQCVLMINMFTEKIFLLLWCWIVALLLLNVAHAFRWLLDLTLQSRRSGHVSRLLLTRPLDDVCLSHKKLIDRFIRYFLGADGVLLIMKVNYHAGNVVASHLVHRLYQHYSAARQTQPKKIHLPVAPSCRSLSSCEDDVAQV